MYSRFSAVVRFSEPPLGTRFRALVGQPCAPTPQSWHRIPGVAANIGHIVSLTFFAGAIAVMDVRLLGGLAATAPGPLLARARLVAIAALAGMAGTGFLLFSAEVAQSGVSAQGHSGRRGSDQCRDL